MGTHRAGIYAFFEVEDSHSFYKGVANRYKLGQISADLELSPKLRLVYGFQGFHNEGTQNIGWNRVTQDLVDKQLYLAGRPAGQPLAQRVRHPRRRYRAGHPDQFRLPERYVRAVLQRPENRQSVRAQSRHRKLVTLPLDRIMIDAGDFSRATTTTAYFDINYDFNDKVHFKNQSFMDWMDHQKFSSYGFGAGYRPGPSRTSPPSASISSPPNGRSSTRSPDSPTAK